MGVSQLNILHYLISEKPKYAVGHCLDFDLVATADSIEEALHRLDALVRCCLKDALENRSTIKSAPKEYWRQFLSAQPYGNGERWIDIKVPEIVPIEDARSHIPVEAKRAA